MTMPRPHRNHARPSAWALVTLRRCCALCLCCLFWVALLRGARSEGLGEALRAELEAGHLAGAVLLVTNAERTLVVDAVGKADLESGRAMSPDAVCWIASMTKPMTAVAVMMLVDEGKIALDDPVVKHVPEFRSCWVAREANPQRMVLERPTQTMTIRHLLSHTSGLPFRSPVEEPTIDVVSLETAVRSYPPVPLESEPGTRYRYSNAGINTAGRIVELVGRMPYHDFMRTRMFEPLGMKDTTFLPTAEQLERLATAYRAKANRSGLEATRIVQLKYPLDGPGRHAVPGGGLFSTAEDCGRFCRMLLGRGMFEGRRILSEAAVSELCRRQTPDGMKESYGLGFNVNGDGSFGHGGAYGTQFTVDPARGIGICWLIQDAGAPPEWRVAGKLARDWALARFPEASR